VSLRRGDGQSRPGKSSAAQRQSILVFTEGKKTELHFQAQAADLHRRKAQQMSSDLLGCAKVPTAAALIQSSAAMRTPGGARRHLTASTSWTVHRHDRTQAAASGALSTRSESPDIQEGNGKPAASQAGLRNWPDR